MERSKAEFILLKESQKGSHFSFKSDTDQELCDWLSVEKSTVISPCSAEQLEKKGVVGRKEQSFSSFGNVNKGFHRFSPVTSRCRIREGLHHFHVKFEHFSASSQFIEQYRRAKELRLEAALNKLMEHTGGVLRSSRSLHRVVETKSKSVTEVTNKSPSRNASCPDQLRHYEKSCQELVNSVKPSLPQTGYFTGKKWIYPKDTSLLNHNYGSNSSTRLACEQATTRGSKLQVKKPEIQVFNTQNMFLKGTGKPINTTSKKTWVVPRQRTVCRSAPVNRQRSHEKILQSSRFFTTSLSTNTPMASSSRSETTNCMDFSSLLERHKGVTFVPKIPRPLQKAGKTEVYGEETDCKQQNVGCTDVFTNAMDFYEHCKQDTRLRAFVRIGT